MSEPLPFDWIISDTHFGHHNINKYAWRLTPVHPTPDHVDELMYVNWNASVKDNESILHAGDLCKWDQGEHMPGIKSLTGKKVLLRGNHDLYPDDWYLQHGFVPTNHDEIQFMVQDRIRVRISHYPIRPERLEANDVNIHGHVHNNPHLSTSRHLNISVETTHFAPVRLHKAVDKLVWSFDHR